jgi:hypothetical protein
MFDRWQRSWELIKASWAVLREDKELLIFPIVSFIGSIIVMITFAVPMIASGVLDASASRSGESFGIFSIIIAFLFYLVMYTVVIFSNVALVGAAMIRLDGGNPTLADGFRIARERFGIIVGYAAISATVGVILRAISERGGIIGQIASSILGFAWGVLTFLVVPVLVMEKIGPVEAIKRSGSLLKTTWGEQLMANFGMGLVFGLASFAVMIVGFGLTALFISMNSTGLVVLGIAATILAIIAVSLVGSALGGIYQAALYRYATTGNVDAHFSPETIQGAFTHKPKRGMF